MSVQIRGTAVDVDDVDVLRIFPSITDQEVITIDVSRHIFDRILEFAEYYDSLDTKFKKLMDSPEILSGQGLRGKNPRIINTWCNKFIDKFKTKDDILEFINIAEHLENEILSNISLILFAREIMNSTPEQFRQKFDIPNDLTEDQVKQLDDEESVYNKT